MKSIDLDVAPKIFVDEYFILKRKKYFPGSKLKIIIAEGELMSTPMLTTINLSQRNFSLAITRVYCQITAPLLTR